MATDKITSYPMKGAVKVEWASLAADETGDSASVLAFRDKTVAVTGTFGGATITIEGSQDGTVWQTLDDPLGTALSFGAAGVAAIMQNTLYIRPNVAGGIGTDVKVTITGNS